MSYGFRGVLIVLVLALGAGCMSPAASPKLGLQRSLYPGLGDVEVAEIPGALDVEVSLRSPLAGGVAWLESSPYMYGASISEYTRTGILQEAVTALRQSPFSQVGTLPTTTAPRYGGDGDDATIDVIRGAAAKFQYDVAFILQTGTAQESGINPFAVGYLGVVTAPLFPGSDLSVAAAAELCAVDVRTGVMLGCGIGRGYEEARFLFPMRVSSRAEDVRERMLTKAVTTAATDVLAQIADRLPE